MNVVCPSPETYARLPVEKYELVRAPGFAFAARAIAARIAVFFVASPLVWKTTTFGGRTPTPNCFSVRWLASYADLPGIEKLWNQRFDTWPAANPPNRVKTSQRMITFQRWRAIRWARRGSIGIANIQPL